VTCNELKQASLRAALYEKIEALGVEAQLA
jgi:hypothetical protein